MTLRACAMVGLGLALLIGGQAQAERRVAVLALHDEAGVGDAAADHLTDLARAAVVGWGAPDLLVMTRENLLALLPPEIDLADCVDDCELETARNVGADYVVTGELRRFAAELRGTLRLHHVPSGRLLASQTAKAAALKGLEPALAQAAARLGKPLRPKPAKARRYAPSRLPTLPALPAPPAAPGSAPKAMTAADVAAAEHYARVVRVEASLATTSAEKAAAWAALAERQPSFAAEAKARAAAWAHRAQQEGRRLRVLLERERRVQRDWLRLQRMLSHDGEPDDQLWWVNDFLEAFGDDPTVSARVEEARRQQRRLQTAVRRTRSDPLGRKVGLPVTVILTDGEALTGVVRQTSPGWAQILVGGEIRRIKRETIKHVR